MSDAGVGKFLNVYWLDREFGGPEEGGWWFDKGWPVFSFRVEVWMASHGSRMMDALRSEFVDHGRRSSVMYMDYDFEVQDYMVEFSDEPAAPFPAVRPHYE